MKKLSAALMVLAGFAGGCSDSDDDEVLCTLELIIANPVVYIDEASGAESGAIIGQVKLTDFIIDGEAVTPSYVVNYLPDLSSNAEIDGDDVICTLPCSFGAKEGNWHFTATAEGYEDLSLSVDASWVFEEAPCPKLTIDGTHVSLELDETGL